MSVIGVKFVFFKRSVVTSFFKFIFTTVHSTAKNPELIKKNKERERRNIITCGENKT